MARDRANAVVQKDAGDESAHPLHPTYHASKADELMFSGEVMVRLRREVKENSPVYVRHRVYRAIKQLLLEGDLVPGDKLPTHAALAAFLHIGSPTVGAAMRLLADEGLVVGIPSQGTFVLGPPHETTRWGAPPVPD